jgi:cephalosporin hydroxylase
MANGIARSAARSVWHNLDGAERSLARRVRRIAAPLVQRWFFQDLIEKTGNFSTVTWLGRPIWQNVLDVWVLQETIAELRPAVIIESGTNRGGSALFMAHLFDLLGDGRVITIDIEKQHTVTHPRITFLTGDSVSPATLAAVRDALGAPAGPVMVILDSDHRQQHVAAEMEAYAPFVTSGSYMLVQDGVIDVLPSFRRGRPGPRPAITDFVLRHPEFAIDRERCERMLITHHPDGWLRRTAAGAA